ncbi:aminoglycoside adenylyltransferase domain-containing protein [Plantactinospora veratri]
MGRPASRSHPGGRRPGGARAAGGAGLPLRTTPGHLARPRPGRGAGTRPGRRRPRRVHGLAVAGRADQAQPRRVLDAVAAPQCAEPGRPDPVGDRLGVLGVARLRHTLTAGHVTSKTDAAAYALDTYGQRWHRVVREALRIRVGGQPSYRNPWRRRADLIGFLTEVLHD